MISIQVRGGHLKTGDIVNGQRIHTVIKHDAQTGHKGKKRAFTYVVLRKRDGRGLEMRQLKSEEFILVKRPMYNLA